MRDSLINLAIPRKRAVAEPPSVAHFLCLPARNVWNLTLLRQEAYQMGGNDDDCKRGLTIRRSWTSHIRTLLSPTAS